MDCPLTANVPTSHGVRPDDSGSGHAYPAWQGVHTPSPSSAKVPSAQATLSADVTDSHA